MATQMQPTPILRGKDAQAVIEQLKRKPTPEQIQAAEKRSELFKGVKKKGL